MQEPQPLGRNLLEKIIGAGRVAARPGEAGDKTKLDRVFADAEDDRDRCGRSFGRLGSKVAAGRGDNGHSAADEVGHERRQAIELALQPMVLHRHVLALDVAGVGEAFAKCGKALGSHLARSSVDEADDRNCRLLRTRRERPRERCAAEQDDEIAPSYT
jgi:hypothetical protein